MIINSSFALSDVLIKMDRGMCYGWCPVYSVQISGDGLVIYEGRDYVDAIGIHKKQISQDEVFELVNRALEIEFFELHDSYHDITYWQLDEHGWVHPMGMHVTDLPTCTTEITIGDNTKSVSDYVGAPQRLRDFEKLIDSVAGTHEWIGEGRDSAPQPKVTLTHTSDS